MKEKATNSQTPEQIIISISFSLSKSTSLSEYKGGHASIKVSIKIMNYMITLHANPPQIVCLETTNSFYNPSVCGDTEQRNLVKFDYFWIKVILNQVTPFFK